MLLIALWTIIRALYDKIVLYRNRDNYWTKIGFIVSYKSVLFHTNRIEKNETSQPLSMQHKVYFRIAECQRIGRSIDGTWVQGPAARTLTRKYFIFIQFNTEWHSIKKCWKKTRIREQLKKKIKIRDIRGKKICFFLLILVFIL